MTAQDILNAAPIDASPGAMASYLDKMCGADSGLREEVERLLAEARGAGRNHPASHPETDVTLVDQPNRATEQPGDTLGNYKLLEKIGEGGFGVVYMAEQAHPVQRQVALKIVKPGMDTREVVARFEVERQALALMDHPNIAKVHDAGTTTTGRPFFVMELVRGVPITRFCDERKLDMTERLTLFAEVCTAINHAHQKGIIHRDLKPSNVLVTLIEDQPVPKVIDFGIAKATLHKLTDKTLFTSLTQLVGTPAYMAPEQVEQSRQDIDTRSDIYSLGVLLYELLTGSTPFDSRTLLDSGFDELRRIIREQDPPKPSTRLGTLEGGELTQLAKAHGTRPDQLTRLVRRDLDWIVMKAIEKDRVRRYQTASDFAEDIRRYLHNEPVSAAGPSVIYRTHKFVRRNRGMIGAAASILLVGLVSVILILGFAARHRQQEADSLLEALFDCRVERLPSVVASINFHAERLDPLLADAAESNARPPSEQARARLALVSRHPVHFGALSNWLLQAPPTDLRIYLGMLEGREAELSVLAWSILNNERASDTSRLQAAAIAAFTDPHNPRWEFVSDRVAGSLVAAGAYNSAAWFPMLRPLGSWLSPALTAVYTDEPDSVAGEMAAHLLSDFQDDDLPALLFLAREAGPRQLSIVAAALARHPGGKAALEAGLATRPAADGGEEPAAQVEQRARLGVTLLLIQHAAPVWPLFADPSEINLRTELIHQIGPYGVDWRGLVPALDRARVPPVITAALAALGGYDASQLPVSVRSSSLRTRLEALYTGHPDPGVRSTAEWLLRQWGFGSGLPDLDRAAPSRQPGRDKQWYVSNSGDYTMAVLPGPIDYMMGSSPDQLAEAFPREGKRPTDEHQHEESIKRTIAVATKEVSYDQFMEFARELQIPNKNQIPDGWENPVSRTGDAAMSFVSLKEAMLYCWWFTNREGIPDEEQCYDFEGTSFAEATVRTRKGYLLKGGYRIMTEAEWEFACRGGTGSTRYFGSSDHFLPSYAWFRSNAEDHTRAPGRLLPNAFGLFDTLGNIAEWCQEPYRSEYLSHPEGEVREVDERQKHLREPEGRWHSFRGGSYYHGSEQLRAAWRGRTPFSATPFTGFRIARTIKVD